MGLSRYLPTPGRFCHEFDFDSALLSDDSDVQLPVINKILTENHPLSCFFQVAYRVVSASPPGPFLGALFLRNA